MFIVLRVSHRGGSTAIFNKLSWSFLTIAAEECLQPVLHIQNLVDIEDYFHTLELFMSNRKHTNGGDIKSFNVSHDQHVGTTSVQVVYEDPKGRLDKSSSELSYLITELWQIKFFWFEIKSKSIANDLKSNQNHILNVSK